MSRLEDFALAVAARLPVTTPAIKFDIGGKRREWDRGWPRVVAVPLSGTTSPGRGYYKDTPAEGGKHDQHALSRRVRIVWEIWAADVTDAEALLHALMIAFADIAGQSEGSFEINGETWLSQERGAQTDVGELVELDTTVSIAVLASDRSRLVLSGATAPPAATVTVPDEGTLIAKNYTETETLGTTTKGPD